MEGWSFPMRLAARYLSLIVVAVIIAARAQCGLAQTRSASMTVDAAHVENSISPMLYGQFVEVMFEGVDGPLWDELIRNRSFEEPPNEIGLSRDWEREPDNRNHDPSVHFQWDGSVSYPEKVKGHSMRIQVSRDQWNISQRRGISQGKILVRKNVTYVGYLWLKEEAFDGFVTVALEKDSTGGSTYASADIHPNGTGWTRYPFTLTADTSDPLAKFSILVHGTGTIWIDQVSLLPGDAVAGTRADVFQRIQDLRPSFIRWPGGNAAQNYHWMRGVGPKDQRPSWLNRAWWNEIESNDFGVDEYIELCRALGTEPSITVNVEGDGATAGEAAAWVEYANGPATSRYGSMRAANGHPEPYHVKYWEVGNEIFGNWEIGHTDAAAYARNFNRYAAAMKAVDPSIRLIASGSTLDWNRTLLQIASPAIDQLAIHFYYGQNEMHGDVNNLLAHPLTFDRFYSQMREILHQYAPDNHIHLTVNEWNTSLPLPAQHTMISGLYAASMLNSFERNGDLVASTAVSDLVNGWSGGIVQASRDGLFVTPTYLVNKLYNDHLGTERLSTAVQSPTFDSPLEEKAVPILDTIATRSADGKSIFVKAVNKDLQHSLTLKLHVDKVPLAPQAEIDSVTAMSPDSENTFANPDAVAIRSSSVAASNDFAIELPPDSVSVVTLHPIETK
jgi:alpha-L-arabinofuranosidase